MHQQRFEVLRTLLTQFGLAGGALCLGASSASAWQCAGDAFEPNESCAQVAAITLGLHSGLTIPDGGADFYRVQVPAGQRLEVRVHLAAPSQLFGVLQLFRDDGSPVPCDAQGSTAGFTLLENGGTDFLVAWSSSVNAPEAFIVALSAQFAACTTYDLDLSAFPDPCAALAPDVFEGNDSCASAAPFSQGTAANLNVSVGDPDYYAVTVMPGELVTMTVAGVPAGIAADIYAWDVSGPCGALNQLSSAGAIHGPSVGGLYLFNISAAAMTHNVRVQPRPNQASQTGFCFSYTLGLQRQLDPCGVLSGDPFEPNDDCASAPPLASSQVGLEIHAWSDADWYAIDVPARSTLRLLSTSHAPPLSRRMMLFSGCAQQDYLTSSVPVYFDADPRQFVQWTNDSALPRNTRLFVIAPHLTVPGAFCDVYDLDFGLTLGRPFCLVKRNSTGEAARITASGSLTPGQGTLALSVAPLPPNKSAIVIMSANEQPALPFGAGYLCLAAPITRYPVTTTGSGTLHLSIDWTGASSAIDLGETWSFQTWFRDPAAGFNGTGTSEALRLTFQ